MVLAVLLGILLAELLVLAYLFLTLPEYRWHRGAFERGLARAPRRWRLIGRGQRIVALRITRRFHDAYAEECVVGSPLLDYFLDGSTRDAR